MGKKKTFGSSGNQTQRCDKAFAKKSKVLQDVPVSQLFGLSSADVSKQQLLKELQRRRDLKSKTRQVVGEVVPKPDVLPDKPVKDNQSQKKRKKRKVSIFWRNHKRKNSCRNDNNIDFDDDTKNNFDLDPDHDIVCGQPEKKEKKKVLEKSDEQVSDVGLEIDENDASFHGTCQNASCGQSEKVDLLKVKICKKRKKCIRHDWNNHHDIVCGQPEKKEKKKKVLEKSDEQVSDVGKEIDENDASFHGTCQNATCGQSEKVDLLKVKISKKRKKCIRHDKKNLLLKKKRRILQMKDNNNTLNDGICEDMKEDAKEGESLNVNDVAKESTTTKVPEGYIDLLKNKKLHYLDPSFSRLAAESSGFVHSIKHTRRSNRLAKVTDNKENVSTCPHVVGPVDDATTPVKSTSCPVSSLPVLATPTHRIFGSDISVDQSFNGSILSSEISRLSQHSNVKDAEDLSFVHLDKSFQINVSPAVEILSADSDGFAYVTIDFVPVKFSWRMAKCQQFGIPLQSTCDPWIGVSDKYGIYRGSKPVRFEPIIPDGNCFFRAISFVLTLSQDHHMEIRQMVAEYIDLYRDRYSAFYSDDSNGRVVDPVSIAREGTWAGGAEQDAVMCLFNTDIYIFLQANSFDWSRGWSCNKSFLAGRRDFCQQPNYPGAIYLIHSMGGRHFDVVLDVEIDSGLFEVHKAAYCRHISVGVANDGSLNKKSRNVLKYIPPVVIDCDGFSTPEDSHNMNAKVHSDSQLADSSLKMKAVNESDDNSLVGSDCQCFSTPELSPQSKIPQVMNTPLMPGKEFHKENADSVSLKKDELPFDFVPVDTTWQNSRCTRLGLPIANVNYGNDKYGVPNSCPVLRREKIVADGNCFFRAISFVMTSSQQHYGLLRKKVAKFMYYHSDFYKDNYTQADGTAPNPEVIARDRTWSELGEQHAMMCLLNTDIFIFPEGLPADFRRWQLDNITGYAMRDKCLSKTDRGIYLIYRSGHFEVCLDIDTSSVVDLGKDDSHLGIVDPFPFDLSTSTPYVAKKAESKRSLKRKNIFVESSFADHVAVANTELGDEKSALSDCFCSNSDYGDAAAFAKRTKFQGLDDVMCKSNDGDGNGVNIVNISTLTDKEVKSMPLSEKSLSSNKSQFSFSSNSSISGGSKYFTMPNEEREMYKARSRSWYWKLSPAAKKAYIDRIRFKQDYKYKPSAELISKSAKRVIIKRKSMRSSEKKRDLAKERLRYQKNPQKKRSLYSNLTPNTRAKRLKKTADAINRRYQCMSSSSKKRICCKVQKRQKERLSKASAEIVTEYNKKRKDTCRLSYQRVSPKTKQKRQQREKDRVVKLTPNAKRLYLQRKSLINQRYKKTRKEKDCLSVDKDYYWDEIGAYSKYIQRGLRRRVNTRRVLVQSFKKASGFGTWKRWKQSIILRLKSSVSHYKHISIFSSRLNACAIRQCVDKTINSWRIAGDMFNSSFRCLKSKWRKNNVDYLVYADSDSCSDEMAKVWGVKRYHVKSNEAWTNHAVPRKYYHMSQFSFVNPMVPILLDGNDGNVDGVEDLDEDDDINLVKRRKGTRIGDVLDDTIGSENDSSQKVENKRAKMANSEGSENDSFISDDQVKVKVDDDELKDGLRTDPLIRACSSQCLLSSDWAVIVHNIIGSICRSDDTWQNMLGIVTMEFCIGCMEAKDDSDCLLGENCTDFIKFLSKLQHHFVGIRSLIRRLYELRHYARYVILCDEVLNKADWMVLRKFVAERRWKEFENVLGKSKRFRQRCKLSVEANVKENFGHLINDFQFKMDDLPLKVCAVCNQYKCDAQLTLKKKEQTKMSKPGASFVWSEVIRVLSEQSEDELEYPLCVCKSCWNYVLNGKNPKFSVLNDMGIDEPPDVIRKLNEVERICLQPVKYFHSIFKLKPMSRHSIRYAGLLNAQKGLGIYLPLPRGTLMMPIQKSTFLDLVHMDILVDTTPTAKKKVWRFPVSVSSLCEAGRYLKEHHEFCHDLVVPSEQQLQKCVDDKKVHVNIIDTLDDREDGELEDNRSAVKENGNDGGTSGCCCNDSDMPRISEDGVANEPVAPSNGINPSTSDEVNNVVSGSTGCSIIDIVPDKMPLLGYSVQDVDPKGPSLLQDLDLYRMERVQGSALYEKKDLNLDVMCFPDLYPKGRFGMDHVRKFKVNTAEFIQARIMHKCGYFRRNQRWVFCMSQYKDAQAIKAGLFSTMNMALVAGKKAKEFVEHIRLPDSELAQSLTTATGGIVGSRSWCYKRYCEASAIDRQAAFPCTLFTTFSFSEKWPGLKDFLLKRNPDLIKYVKQDIGFMVQEDPLSVSEFFHLRFKYFFNTMINTSNGVFGSCVHYWYRLEYQARGAPHMHCKLWIEDAPVSGKDDSEVIVKWVDSNISCAMPSKDIDPYLYDLVYKYQLHHCTASCRRWHGKRPYCRYGYPRDPVDETKVNSVEDVIRASNSRKRGKRVRLVDLKRSAYETTVNDYNAALLIAWAANIDVQFTSDKHLVVNRYCTGYACKGEKNWTEDVWNDLDPEKSSYSRLMTVVRRSMAKRELGIMEAGDRCLGVPVIDSSFKCLYVNTDVRAHRRRRLKPLKEINKLDPESTDICFKSLVDTDYPNRPDTEEFNDMCLHDFAALFDVSRQPKHKSDVELQNKMGFLQRKKNRYVITYRTISPNSPEKREAFFHQLLMLYLPYRDETELLAQDGTYMSMFELKKNEIERLSDEHHRSLRLQEGIDLMENIRREEEAKDDDIEEEWDQAVIDVENSGQSLGSVIPNVVVMSEDQVAQSVGQLNTGQREAYDRIIAGLKHNDRHIKGLCNCNDYRNVMMFVSGFGGTGKTKLINCVTNSVVSMFEDLKDGRSGIPVKVAIAAPTGIAAINVNGVTLHRLFSLPVRTGYDPQYSQLPADNRKRLSLIFDHVRLIIIDEISMVSNTMLISIDMRLREITRLDESFGGKNIIVMGDFFQLRPVFSDFVFMNLDVKKSAHLFQVPYAYSPWHEFLYAELTENMRQKDDLEWSQILGRCRIGIHETEDVLALSRRCVVKHEESKIIDVIHNQSAGNYLECSVKELAAFFIDVIVSFEPSALALFPLNLKVEAFNKYCMEKLGIKTIQLNCSDSYLGGANKKLREKLRKQEENKTTKSSDTGGLEKVVEIGVGCRVMLRKNLDQAKGLVNGSLGKVIDIRPRSGKCVNEIIVKFDIQPDLVCIKKAQSSYDLKYGVVVTRRQFPLCPAYAITIHKSQGLTLNAALVDCGNDVFEEGMAYVCLSRVKSLQRLYLSEFNPDQIWCDSRCIREYRRLRDTIQMSVSNIMVWNLRGLGGKNRKKIQRDPVTSEEAQKKANIEAAALPSVYHIKFATDRRSSFADTVVQLLIHMEFMMLKLSAADPKDLAMKELLWLKMSRDSGESALFNTLTLRKYLGCRGDYWQLDAVWLFIEMIHKRLPLSCKRLWALSETTEGSCSVCHKKSQIASRGQICYLQPKEPSLNSSVKFVDFLISNDVVLHECVVCCDDTLHSIWKTYAISSMNQFVLIRLQQYTEDMMSVQVKYTNFVSVKVKVGNTNYRLIGAIEQVLKMESDRPNYIHHIAWVRTSDNKWLKIDGSNSDRVAKLKGNLGSFCLLLLERL